ncbi:low molecular weight protein arginine phosphatase [Candidatus Latescibacterota bacterium]
MLEPFLVVFVCTGNICRSPMAEGILKEMLTDEAERSGALPPLQVMSAGTHAMDGFNPSEYAVMVAAEEGIDISNYISRFLTGDVVDRADLILTMERDHTEMITHVWPNASAVYDLTAFASTPGKMPVTTDIHDPIGCGKTIYRNVFSEIKREIERVAPVIIDLARKKAREG